ncbi:hypothetical protein [Nocardioides sp. NPDC006273]|uniref:hypothetical protein n=1 Tax=Nocardioides sp. NPDC006273 TaxID=3155598 RepID=UPI0033BF8963
MAGRSRALDPVGRPAQVSSELRADGAAPPPRWAIRAAHVASLTTLPSGLWRVALAIGLPVGYSEASARELFDAPGAGSAYLIGLTVLLELLSLLSLGLVRPWGEVVPRWVPLLGGRGIPPRAVVISAAAGAAALTALWVPFAVLWWWSDGDGHLTGTAHALVGLTYLPLALWGPLLGALTWSYHRRHKEGRP